MKIAAPIVLILLALVGLIVMGVLQHGVPELQVSDVLKEEFAGQEVKVHGLLEKIESAERPLRFTVRDKVEPSIVIEVYADRTRPDTFQETYDVAVLGRYDKEAGHFEADQIFTKCPSKYEAEDKLKYGTDAPGGVTPPGSQATAKEAPSTKSDGE